MSDLPVVIRELRDTDIPLILDSWVNSVRYSTPAFWWVPNGICKSIYRQMVTRLLEAKPELFRVLVNEADEDQIFAWVCVGEDTLYFLYVKKEFRGEGLGELLLWEFKERLWDKHGLGGRPGTFAGAQKQEHERSKVKIPVANWTSHCEGRRDLSYKPSLFRELINGINKTVGRGTAEDDKHAGKVRADNTGGQHRQAVDQAVGMVT